MWMLEGTLLSVWANRAREGGKLEQTATCHLPVTLAEDVETNKVEVLVTIYQNNIKVL